MSVIRKLLGQTALYGVSSIVGRLLNYLLVPMYARTLSVADNGVINELYAYAGVLMVLYSYRLESAFFRFGAREDDRHQVYRHGVATLGVSTLLITGALLLFSGSLATGLRYEGHPEYIRYFALILALDCLAELPFARLRLEERPMRFVTGKLLHIGVNIACNLFWLLWCPWAYAKGMHGVRAVWSPEVGVGYVFISNLTASAVTLLFLAPLFKGLRGPWDSALFRRMLRYSAPLIVVQLAGVSNQLLDRVLLRWLLPGSSSENLEQLGIYGNNFKLAMMVGIFTQAYRYAAEPFFFRKATDPDAPETLAQAAKYFTLVASVGVAGILLLMDWLRHLLTPAYFEGLKVLPPLLMANLLTGIYYNLSVWYRLRDKTMYGAWITLAALGVTLSLNLLLTPRIGYMGAAWASLGSSAGMCWAAWYWGRMHYPTPYRWGAMARYALTPFVLYGLLWKLGEYLEPGKRIWVGAGLLLLYLGDIMRRERLFSILRGGRFGP